MLKFYLNGFGMERNIQLQIVRHTFNNIVRENKNFPNITLCENELHLVIVCYKSINL